MLETPGHGNRINDIVSESCRSIESPYLVKTFSIIDLIRDLWQTIFRSLLTRIKAIETIFILICNSPQERFLLVGEKLIRLALHPGKSKGYKHCYPNTDGTNNPWNGEESLPIFRSLRPGDLVIVEVVQKFWVLALTLGFPITLMSWT